MSPSDVPPPKPGAPPSGPIGELDLHLLGERHHRRLWEVLGPQVVGPGPAGVSAVQFALWAPNANNVSVVGDWNDWLPEPLSMIDADGPTGIWSAVCPAARAGHCYKFEIVTAEGQTLRKADPMARQTEEPPSDASVIPMPQTHEWADDAWMSRRSDVLAGTAPMRIYELHLASWRRGVDTIDPAIGFVAYFRAAFDIIRCVRRGWLERGSRPGNWFRITRAGREQLSIATALRE